MNMTVNRSQLDTIILTIRERDTPIRARYCEGRVTSHDVAQGDHVYAVRESDGGSGEPCTIEQCVGINHVMDIITTDNPTVQPHA